MSDRLFEEGRANNEYRSAFEHAAYTLLREEGKMEAIERTVYKKLFGDDPKDKEDDAKNAKSTPAPKKRKVAESNDGKSAETSVTTTITKEEDTQDVEDLIESDITKVVASISYRDQAAKTPPPPEEKQLTDRVKRIMANQEALKEKMGPEAFYKILEAIKNNEEIAARRDAILDKRNKLLPMRPGGRIQQFSTYAPPTPECENYWFAEDGAQIKKVEQRLNVSVSIKRLPDLASTSKSMMPVEATESLKKNAGDQWKTLPAVIKVQDRKLREEHAARIKANIVPKTILYLE
ncbi:hypothetical protein BOTCAL_0097g00130 [Botryotinia calthae]|uniref:Uncharacterized protein n=1 Tax=Botryotinia calthae TaxID=38488 RepID=A0A4Y8D8W6_9HELO|nr:hypothetical protein BOTCAL_0097g00130 [Botryotinia calthae]